MTEFTAEREYVAFVHVCARKKPTWEQFKTLTAVHAQGEAIARFEQLRGAKVTPIYSVTTNSRKPPTTSVIFWRAVESAAKLGTPLLVSNVEAILYCSQSHLRRAAGTTLDELPVELYDMSRGKTWRLFANEDKRSVQNSIATRVKNGAARMDGIDETQKRAIPAANVVGGPAGGRRAADRWAKKLSVRVEEIAEELPNGVGLKPSHLARRLNERGVPARRGGEWSFNSAKNLMSRLGLEL